MELCVNDKIAANPSKEDVTAALETAPHPEGWYLVLESDDDSYVEASALPNGTYEVTASDKGRDLKASAPFTANRLKKILLEFHAGDRAWHASGFAPVRQSTAENQRAITAARSGSQPPTWAMAAIVGSIVFVVLAFIFLRGRHNSLRDWLPFGHSDFFYVWLIFLPMIVLVVVAVIVKMREVSKASTWATAAGRVVRSETKAQHHRFGGEATTVKTVPLVEYEFSVGGRTWRGSRVSIGEDAGGANTEATLRRYPVGAVVSVHYDPADPGSCVLEPGLPAGIRRGLLALLAIGIAVAAGLYGLVTYGPGLVADHLPDGANAPVVLFAACFGLLVLLLFFASYSRSRKAADWPVVRGMVLTSMTERIEKRADGATRITYAPVVEYAYRVHDVDYVSRQIKLGIVISSSEAYAAKVAARYPQGQQIDVHYDPENPSNAALENPTGMHWLLPVMALACFAIAARAGGLI